MAYAQTGKVIGLEDIVGMNPNSTVVFDACGLIHYQDQLESFITAGGNYKMAVLKSTLDEVKTNPRIVCLVKRYMTVIDDEALLSEENSYSGCLYDTKEIMMLTDKHLDGLAALLKLGKLKQEDLQDLPRPIRNSIGMRELDANYAEEAHSRGFEPQAYIRSRILASEEDARVLAYALYAAETDNVVLVSEDSHVRQAHAMMRSQPDHGYQEPASKVRLPRYTRRAEGRIQSSGRFSSL